MTSPITIDLPHSLGAEEAKRRIQDGMGDLKAQIPGGADVSSSWTENRLRLGVVAMGQDVRADIDVHEAIVRVQLVLPPALGFFAKPIEALLRRQGKNLLEDKSGSRGT